MQTQGRCRSRPASGLASGMVVIEMVVYDEGTNEHLDDGGDEPAARWSEKRCEQLNSCESHDDSRKPRPNASLPVRRCQKDEIQ